MKKGSRFLIGLASAGLTFGALMMTLGVTQFNKFGYRHHHHWHHECYHYQGGQCHSQDQATAK